MIGPGAALLDTLGRVMALPLDGRQLRMSRHFLFCDTHKARTELGLLEARPFRRAVEDTYAWYREQGIL
jgi:nucleoside-diphosphate-sugar epimerase